MFINSRIISFALIFRGFDCVVRYVGRRLRRIFAPPPLLVVFCAFVVFCVSAAVEVWYAPRTPSVAPSPVPANASFSSVLFSLSLTYSQV